MAKDGKRDRVKRETADTNERIAGAYEKLATRFRDRMQKAAEKKGRQEALRKRSELFGQAAKELEDKVAKLRKSGP